MSLNMSFRICKAVSSYNGKLLVNSCSFQTLTNLKIGTFSKHTDKIELDSSV